MRPAILSTPIAARTSFGIGWDQCWANMLARVQRFSPPSGPFAHWPKLGLVASIDDPDEGKAWRSQSLVDSVASELGQALRETADGIGAMRGIALLATSHGDPDASSQLADASVADLSETARDTSEFIAAMPLERRVHDALGLHIPVRTLAAACASACVATGLAARLVETDRADYVVILSFDLLSRVAYTGFSRAGALSRNIARPFDTERDGINIGEAIIGFVVVDSERFPSLKSVAVLGAGNCCDNGHLVEPRVEGVTRSIGRALANSALPPQAVGAIYWHGTGTSHNDRVEAEAAFEIFDSKPPPGTSTKSMMGHCMGASAAINILAAMETFDNGSFPGIPGLESPAFPSLNVAAEVRTIATGRPILVNALGFGGINSSLLLAET